MQDLDLNLLAALEILLREQSVTVAAEKMNLSVPAMSRTLTRIRALMKDPILVRAGMRLVPTAKAVELHPLVTALMEQTRSLVSAAHRRSLREEETTFTVRAEEAFTVLVDQVNTRLAEQAPKIRLRLVTRTSADATALRDGTVQLDIGQRRTSGPEIKVQRLFDSVSVGVARRDHPLFTGKVTARRFAAQRHVNASRRGVAFTPIDAELEKLGLRRTVALVVPSFHAAMFAAASSPLIATIPEILAHQAARLQLRTFPVPVAVRPSAIAQSWHPRFDADPVHRFLRECVTEACRAVLSPLRSKAATAPSRARG